MSKKDNSKNSKETWNKIQDFLYDSIDYICIILVIALVSIIINWRLGGLFKSSDIHNLKNTQSEQQIDDTKEKSKEKDKQEENKLDTKKDNKDKEVKKKKKETKIIKVNIPKGSVSQDVSQILEDEKVIKDRKEFYEYVQKKKMETKLKYGNYEIPDDSTFDEIIKILTK